MTEKVALTIRLNKNIHDALVLYKKKTGLSVSSQIYTAIAAFLFQKKLLTLDEVNGK